MKTSFVTRSSFFGTASLVLALLSAPTTQAQQANAAEQPIQWESAPAFSVYVRSLNQSPRFVLSVQNPEGKTFGVEVRNETGKVEYAETVHGERKYGRLYNLSPLNDGQYTFVVRNGRQRYTQTFQISSNTDRLVTKVGSTGPAEPTKLVSNPAVAAAFQQKPD